MTCAHKPSDEWPNFWDIDSETDATPHPTQSAPARRSSPMEELLAPRVRFRSGTLQLAYERRADRTEWTAHAYAGGVCVSCRAPDTRGGSSIYSAHLGSYRLPLIGDHILSQPRITEEGPNVLVTLSWRPRDPARSGATSPG